MSNTITHLLSQTAYWRVPKGFVSKLGLVKGFILTDLVDKYEFYKSRGKLQDGYFYYKRGEMLELYPIGETTLRSTLKELEEKKLISMKLEQNGLDRKTCFSINSEEIEQLLENYIIEKSQENGIQEI